MFVPMVMLLGLGVVLIRRRLLASPDATAERDDAPARLLRWSTGLLAAERAEWGQAMLGELDRLEGRARRWRFAAGCGSAVLVLPPWGRAAAAIAALAALAASAVAVVGYTRVHYGLATDGWTWVLSAVLLALLAGHVLGGSVLLRRPGVAGPGLAGGLFVAAAWLTVQGVTFTRFITWISPAWTELVLVLVVPTVTGAACTLYSGSADAGRRAARLAAVSAGLALYLYGVLAVAVIGAGGAPVDATWTVAYQVNDSLTSQATFYLIQLPLATATVGWAAAAATARLRGYAPVRALPFTPAADAIVTPAPAPLPAVPVAEGFGPAETPPAPGGADRAGRAATTWRVAVYLLLFAAMAGAVLLAVASWLRP